MENSNPLVIRYTKSNHETNTELEITGNDSTSGEIYSNLYHNAHSNFDFDKVTKQLDAKMFKYEKSSESIVTITTDGGVRLQLHKIVQSSENKIQQVVVSATQRIEELLTSRAWKKVGTLQEFDNLWKTYPPTEWEWGGTYNNLNPMPLIISQWNKGYRVMFRDFYIHGDDAKQFHLGNCVWTRDTLDVETANAKWPDGAAGFLQKYVNSSLAPCCGSNGVGGLVIYVRRF